MDKVKALRLICESDQLSEDDALRFLLKDYNLILIRRKGKLFGYRNECPHMNLPLTTRSKAILSNEQDHLLCSQHAAEFDIQNGLCVKGPCVGMELETVEVELIDGKIFLKV